MRAIFKVFLLSLVLSASWAGAEQFTELAKKSWIDPFTQSFLSDLVPVRPKPGQMMDALRRQTVELRNRDSNEKTEYILNMRFFKKPGGKDQIVVVTTIHPKLDPKSVVGVWAMTVIDRTREVKIEYLKFADEFLKRHEGGGSEIFAIYNEFLDLYNSSFDRIEAGWLGRYVWAKQPFEFDPRVTVFENGREISQRELMRANFRRFCEHYNLDISNLKNQDYDSLSPDLHELVFPSDFTTITDKTGKKITVRPYIDHDTLGESRTMEVGKAFSTMDYRPGPAQANQIEVGGLPRSDIAMPPWHGMHQVGCVSHLRSLRTR